MRRETAAGSRLLSLSAGCAFAWTGISSKLIADFLSSSSWAAVVAWAAATGLVAAVGLLSEMSALQRRPATRVAPVVFVVQITVPVMLAPVIGDEAGIDAGRGSDLFWLPRVRGGGFRRAGRSPAVSGLVAAGVDQPGDGHAPVPPSRQPAVQ